MRRESGPGPHLIVKWAYNRDAGPPSNGRALRPPLCGPSQIPLAGRGPRQTGPPSEAPSVQTMSKPRTHSHSSIPGTCQLACTRVTLRHVSVMRTFGDEGAMPRGGAGSNCWSVASRRSVGRCGKESCESCSCQIYEKASAPQVAMRSKGERHTGTPPPPVPPRVLACLLLLALLLRPTLATHCHV